MSYEPEIYNDDEEIAFVFPKQWLKRHNINLKIIDSIVKLDMYRKNSYEKNKRWLWKKISKMS